MIFFLSLDLPTPLYLSHSILSFFFISQFSLKNKQTHGWTCVCVCVYKARARNVNWIWKRKPNNTLNYSLLIAFLIRNSFNNRELVFFFLVSYRFVSFLVSIHTSGLRFCLLFMKCHAMPCQATQYSSLKLFRTDLHSEYLMARFFGNTLNYIRFEFFVFFYPSIFSLSFVFRWSLLFV